MYIKSLIIDGFKSYGKRTEVHGFDREFTAITGLNGAGKSNLLDAICFVLGITNLKDVRATSMQELIFKSGQAGVTKATVTIVFDNTDPNICPFGYEKCREISVTRQIAVGGKNKYLINGKNMKHQEMVDFFCSVQMNVNNPNFLIMQGRITKVLNMKPQEILSMIKEAAGTSQYESKRNATYKIIEKKDHKVRETADLLKEEVEPRLDKLREQRVAYQRYQQVIRDIEYSKHVFYSHRYLQFKKDLTSIETTIEKLNNRIELCKSTITQNEMESAQLEEVAKDMQLRIDNESGGALKEIEKELLEKSKIEATFVGNLKSFEKNIELEKKKVKSLEKNINDDKHALKEKEGKMSAVQELFHNLKEADENDARAYEAAQRKLEDVTKGLSTNEDGEASSLQEQLINAKQQLSEAETNMKTSSMELRHCRTVLRQKEGETQNNDTAYEKDKNLKKNLQQQITAMRNKISNLNYEEGAFERLKEQKNNATNEIRKIQSELDRHNAYRYQLHYKPPSANFDKNKVRGMVGKLFDVPDPRNYMALKMTAAGHLFSYVTDDDVTSREILEKGQLQNRVTIIPINKIMSGSIDQNKINYAQSMVGKENVQSALSLIKYDPYYEPVMKFVFGHTLVCRDLNIAKQVTYNRNINCRSVTLDGDLVDPEGTLSGGSRPSGGEILKEIAEIKHLEMELKNRQIQVGQIEQNLASMENLARTYNHLKETLELRQHELNTISDRLAQTSIEQHKEEINAMKIRIISLEEELAKARESKNTADLKVKDIEAKLADSKGYRERELKAASEAMKLAKQKSEESSQKWKDHEQDFETLKMEIQELEKGIVTATEQREKLLQKIETMKGNLEDERLKHSAIKNEVDDLKKQIKEQKDKIHSQNKELKQLYNKKENLLKQKQELTLEIKKKENDLNKARNENKDAAKNVDALEKKFPWIIEDREFFGLKNTRYDYSKEDPEEAGRKLTSLQAEKSKMERHINIRAQALLEREDEHYQETIRKKQIVDQDKVKLEKIISRMDEKKVEKVQQAWTEVNLNFQSIFSTLLFGAQSCLHPLVISNELIGLEIRVGFNGVWKDSLGELSGGQRSLVALSLVLAMLKFSPAPLYILDEIDAALDMSHTQNIGTMLARHFKKSQFIVVSLKDGMFNNANVLLRAKFENNISWITRSVNKNSGTR